MTANADAGLPYRREAAARRPSLDIGDGLMIETKNPLLSLIPSQNAYAAVPTPEELKARLASRISEVGQPALAEFAYIQRRAAEVWGPAPTAHFARVLRDARVSAKAPRASKWKKAKAAVPRLPSAWRDVFQKKIEVSEAGKTVAGEPPWSADYLLSVINALAAWSGFCEAHGLPLAPTGANLERYARGCVNRNHNPVSERDSRGLSAARPFGVHSHRPRISLTRLRVCHSRLARAGKISRDTDENRGAACLRSFDL